MNDTSTAPQLMTPKETAYKLAVCPSTLWKMTKRGVIPCVRVGRSVRYDPTDIEAYIRQQKSTAPASKAG